VKGGELGEGESLRLLGDSYPAGEVPDQVKDRLEKLVATSGSSVRNDLVSILYYRMRYWRLSPVFALIPGTWQDARPGPARSGGTLHVGARLIDLRGKGAECGPTVVKMGGASWRRY
jgi:hypothetical protein